MKFQYGEKSFIFTGDISSEIERLIIDRYMDESGKLSSDILKVAHHGSKYSSDEEFVKLVGAKLAVISVGKNTYGHPASETIMKLEESGTKVLRTDKSGAIVVKTDGEEVAIFMYGE